MSQNMMCVACETGDINKMYIYPMARTVRVHAIVAAMAAAGKLPTVHERMCVRPEIVEAAPTTPASNANVTKNPVAAFPIGK